MLVGHPNQETGPASASDTATTADTDGGNESDESGVSQIIATAKRISAAVSPFVSLLTGIVQAITAYKLVVNL